VKSADFVVLRRRSGFKHALQALTWLVDGLQVEIPFKCDIDVHVGRHSDSKGRQVDFSPQ
jgi:hypothetical protein